MSNFLSISLSFLSSFHLFISSSPLSLFPSSPLSLTPFHPSTHFIRLSFCRLKNAFMRMRLKFHEEHYEEIETYLRLFSRYSIDHVLPPL